MANIIVTGSVATGKTTLAKALAKKLHYTYLDANTLINKHKEVVTGYDTLRKTKEIDTKRLNKILLEEIKKSKKGTIIDSHLSHYLPAKNIDLCIVCKCSLKTLKKRLKQRNYSKLKIRENLDAEIFDVCLTEALEAGHNVQIAQTEKSLNKELTRLSQIIQRKNTPRH